MSETDLILFSTVPLREDALQCRELPRAAVAATDDLVRRQRMRAALMVAKAVRRREQRDVQGASGSSLMDARHGWRKNPQRANRPRNGRTKRSTKQNSLFCSVVVWYSPCMDQSIEQLIDAEIQQLVELKRMAKNPRMVELMRQLVVGSPNGVQSAAATPAADVPARRASGTKASDTTTNSTAPNGLSSAVLQAARTLRTGFSTAGIVEHLNKTGFQFISKSPKVAVAAPLERMLKKKLLRMSHKGTGNQPHLYDYIGEKEEAHSK